jgi:hypothetical protein
MGNLDEGLRAVQVLGKVADIYATPDKVARLMADYGDNGRVDSEEFCLVFDELREVVGAAFE